MAHTDASNIMVTDQVSLYPDVARCNVESSNNLPNQHELKNRNPFFKCMY